MNRLILIKLYILTYSSLLSADAQELLPMSNPNKLSWWTQINMVHTNAGAASVAGGECPRLCLLSVKYTVGGYLI